MKYLDLTKSSDTQKSAIMWQAEDADIWYEDIKISSARMPSLSQKRMRKPSVCVIPAFALSHQTVWIHNALFQRG